MKTLLIANRGEIARRIQRSARAMGIGTVAVYADADAHALHVREADTAVALGGLASADSYLRIDKLIGAARSSGADAVHPGYGFLSENAAFAQAVIDAGLIWVGPPPSAIRALGDKAAAKALALVHGVPCLPGYSGADQDDATFAQQALAIGFPLMVKAVAGGGGRGMRLVSEAAQLLPALHSARSEALAGFGNGDLLIERALPNPRHIEVQIFADALGHCIHLGERDCSVQRRHQKIIEEAPSPAVTAAQREELGRCAVALAQAAGYVGAGTVEFLMEGDGVSPLAAGSGAARFYLMEMNTRLQVEHPVTEALTGLDLVEWQLRVARGEPLPLTQDRVRFNGHAIEVRLCAEDDHHRPHSGKVALFRAPDGLRCDHALENGSEVTPHYDALLGKLIAHAPTRAEAIDRLAHALDQTLLLGLPNNRTFLAACLRHPVFRAGEARIPFLAEHGDGLREAGVPGPGVRIQAALAVLYRDRAPAASLPCPFARSLRWAFGPDTELFLVQELGQGRLRVVHGEHSHEAHVQGTQITLDGQVCRAQAVGPDALGRWHVVLQGARTEELVLGDVSFAPPSGPAALNAACELRAPFNGKLVQVLAQVGDALVRGAPLLVIESMKLEHTLCAPLDAVLEGLQVAPGQQLSPGQLLATFTTAEPRP